jgi:hypothetical protein
MKKQTTPFGLKQAITMLCANVALTGGILCLHAGQAAGAAETSAAGQPQAVPAQSSLFAKTNLAAWCIVPFDSKKRGPEERAEMLDRLGFRLFAYDYRAEHIPTFDAEMEAIQRHHIELLAWWFPVEFNDEARLVLDVIKRHGCHPQLWVTGWGAPVKDAAEQQARVEQDAQRVRPIAEAAAKIGCIVALYNHGGWFGEPENQIAIIERLRTVGVTNVSIVYNFNHAQDQIDRFPVFFPKIQPYLTALNLAGLRKGSQEIYPIGEGGSETEMIRIIWRSTYRGPIGLINENTDPDAEAGLKKNLDGLQKVLKNIGATGALRTY